MAVRVSVDHKGSYCSASLHHPRHRRRMGLHRSRSHSSDDVAGVEEVGRSMLVVVVVDGAEVVVFVVSDVSSLAGHS